ncbi:hypothetical protein [Rubrobacter naiadicus]|uniref:hypothetical protein n=1 Tax=Rubrobacter naiadicus TaxID=1392641 RepID=UPI002362C93F|nr:hypothetical protein [Rubrobacter naiadicus]
MKICIAALIVFGFFWIAPVLLVTTAGIFVMLVTAFIATTAITSVVALLAIDFLYPQTVISAGLLDLLWLVVMASTASVLLFDFLIDGFLLWALRYLVSSKLWVGMGEAFAGGIVTALMLALCARLMPGGVELSAGAALAAAQISAFVRYYMGLYLGDTSDKDRYIEHMSS